MAVLDEPFSRITDANGKANAGSRYIYDENTSNLSTIYSNAALSVTQANPVPSDAGGALPPIYVASATYKIIDKAVDGTILFENDHYPVPNLSGLNTITFSVVQKSADFTVTSADYAKVFEVDATGGQVTVTMDSATNGNGMPCFIVKKDATANNVVLSAGGGQTFNGGSSTYSLTQQNQCAGVASEGAAGWRIFLIPAPTATPIKPQGRLTLATGVPVLPAAGGYGSGEANAAATTLYYTAFEGQYVPIWDGNTWQVKQFAADLSLALDANAGHTQYHQALKAFDVFLANDNGTLRLVTGPAWTTAGNYVSAGSLTTGTAARAAAISRVNGIVVNTSSMTGRYGSVSGNTITVAAGQGTYVGTIWIDATDGQLSCHVAFGQNRKWGVWNAYNRKLTSLLIGDTTVTWAGAGTNVFRAWRGQTANSGTVVSGLAEDYVNAATRLSAQAASGGGTSSSSIGIASLTVASGIVGVFAVSSGTTTPAGGCVSDYRLAPFLGCQAFTALEKTDAANTLSVVGAGPAGNQATIDFWA